MAAMAFCDRSNSVSNKIGAINGSFLKAGLIDEISYLTVPIAATFPFPDVATAYARFEKGAKLGKIVLLADD